MTSHIPDTDEPVYVIDVHEIGLPDFETLPAEIQQDLNKVASLLLLHTTQEERSAILAAYRKTMNEVILEHPRICKLEHLDGKKLKAEAYRASLWFSALALHRADHLVDRMPTEQTGSTLIN